MQLTDEQNALAAQLFAPAEDKREGKTRLTVRFDPKKLELLRPVKYNKSPNRTLYKGLTLLRYFEGPATTPTGGRYTRRAITVRSKDGRLWYGTLKGGTDVVKLRLAPKEEDQ